MKNLPTFVLILFAVTFVNSGCKKGEKDPAISLLTRKARVVGEWRMKTGYASYTSMQAKSGVSYYLQFDGSRYTGDVTPTGAAAYIYKGIYSLYLSFGKDGSFTVKESWDGDNLVAKGTWNFTSKVGKDKNKEGIIIVLNSVESDATSSHLFNKFSTEFTYKIIQLKSKEMIIDSGTPLYIDDSGGRESFQNNYTLVSNF
ncbi:MAG: hypothetical protein V4635_03575 [Bacteroidota bacterium]